MTKAALCSALPLLTTGALFAGSPTPQPLSAQDRPVNRDAKTMASFTERVGGYLALQKSELAKLPKLKDDSSPLEIDQHQRALGAAIVRARASARQGDLFTPDMQRVARALMRQLFADPRKRRELREAVMDENPTNVRFTVNDRYPDAVPLSTMPPDVLRNLPPLPEGLEYRFVGDVLILLDPDAHLVVDFVTRVLPK